MRLKLNSEETFTNTQKALYWLKLESTGYSCLSLSVTVSKFSRCNGHITFFASL